MFCPKCGGQVPDGGKFCPKCGGALPDVSSTKEELKQALKANPVQVEAAAPAPAPAVAVAPAPAPAPGTVVDVKNIIKSPAKNVTLDGIIDFKAAEVALESEGLKTKAFSGIFSSAQAHEVRVDSLTMIYEPVNMVRAVYEGTFEVVKDFNLALDPDTTKVVIESKSYDIKPVASGGGLFGGGSSSSLKLTGTETINKRKEKGVYYDMNGVMKMNIETYIKGKKTAPFDPAKQMTRTQVLATTFDASGLSDKVITPDIITRQLNAKKTVSEKITVDTMTVYYPKYKALVTNLKNNQQKYVVFSGVDKSLFSTETF